STYRFFLFAHTPPPEFYTLSLHDALPISWSWSTRCSVSNAPDRSTRDDISASDPQIDAWRRHHRSQPRPGLGRHRPHSGAARARSEEHTSELQSRGHLVCRLLLEKKKKNN